MTVIIAVALILLLLLTIMVSDMCLQWVGDENLQPRRQSLKLEVVIFPSSPGLIPEEPGELMAKGPQRGDPSLF
jgi:hypothetical protein